MTTSRALVFAGLAGVVAAAVLVAFVLVRDGGAESASASGHLIHIHTELFIRENPFREFPDRPLERTIHDVWLGPVDDGTVGISTVTSLDGSLRWRSRFGSDTDVVERVSSVVVLVRPRSGIPFPTVPAESLGITGVSPTEQFMGVPFESEPGPRVGDVRHFARFPASQSDGADGAVTAGYAGNLDTSQIEMELVVRGGLLRSKQVWALLHDGGRVLIESRALSYFTMPISRWHEVEAAVWPE